MTWLSSPTCSACPGFGKTDEPKVPNQLDHPFLAPVNVSVASCECNSAWQNSDGSWYPSHVSAISSKISAFSQHAPATFHQSKCWGMLVFGGGTGLDHFILLKIQGHYLNSKWPVLVLCLRCGWWRRKTWIRGKTYFLRTGVVLPLRCLNKYACT